jgi:alkylation response protein AidB-like acyl-CoA dehydrogenase
LPDDPTVHGAQALALADELAPRLDERAADAEAHRRLHDETIAECEPLWPLVVPTSLGGRGADLGTLLEVTRRLARGCPASAWTISFLIMHSWLVAKLPDAVSAGVLRPERPFALCPAPLAPTGTLRPAEGGYVVNGAWEWATGVSHAEWVLVHGLLDGPEFSMRFALVRRDDVAVDDVWHTSGMAATGSQTVRVDEVFVPEGLTLDSGLFLRGQVPIEGDGLAGMPTIGVLALMAATPALGAAERAVDIYRTQLAERTLAYTIGDRARDQPAAQIRLATAIADVDAIAARWERTAADLQAAAHAGSVDERLRVRVRLVGAATVRDARRVINHICEGAGARPYFSDQPLQRIQRDVEVLKGHTIFDWDRAAELAGRIELGDPLGPTDMA